MIFSSVLFLFYFLPIVLFVYYISPKKIKNFILLVASLVFYAWGEPTYIVLMIFTIVLNYHMALVISESKSQSKRKRVLVEAIVIDLLILGYFKYYGFFIDSINSIFSTNIEVKQLALPVGISFYTFQTLSYVIDVYWKKVNVQKNIITFGTYIAMFPQLIAGPIVKYSDVEKQMVKRPINMDNFGLGAERFILGLGKKVLLANNIGMLWDTISATDLSQLSVLSAWLGMIAYTFQIYFDFSGYSDMAIGLGRMLGFKFMENFNYPYIADSVTDFWRRWHISLSTWFREYVYIPLGGNRVGAAKHIRNLLIVWALTGFWHGASYNFLMWGLYYGVLLIIEKYALGKVLNKLPNVVRWLYTILIVMIGWIFFAAPDLSWAVDYIKVLFGSNGVFCDATSLYYLESNFLLLLILSISATPALKYIFDWLKGQKSGGILISIVIQIAILVLATAFLVNASYNPFLYFRF